MIINFLMKKEELGMIIRSYLRQLMEKLMIRESGKFGIGITHLISKSQFYYTKNLKKENMI
jgi:hypothetical protein